jgi:WbqC-like protein family
MARTAVITQPTYLPWLGYFEQIARADVFVFLDIVQFERRSWQCRNRLKGTNGQPFWLTVPVMAHPRTACLPEIRLAPDHPQFHRKHLRSIQMHLGSAPYFHDIFPHVQHWINTKHEYLVDLNIAGIRMLSELLGLSPLFVRASELNPQDHRTRLLANLCQQVGAERYYSSAGSKAYMEEEEELFAEVGIQLVYQDWKHPIYTQCGGGFVSHLSALDALMNIGPQAVRSLLVPDGS